jgi:hypothetical protein
MKVAEVNTKQSLIFLVPHHSPYKHFPFCSSHGNDAEIGGKQGFTFAFTGVQNNDIKVLRLWIYSSHSLAISFPQTLEITIK